jgi:cell wall-associated NlpC family hydrolase
MNGAMWRMVVTVLSALALFAATAGADDTLMAEARALASQGIRYGAAVQVEGDGQKWVMDCSNAARYLISRTRGVELPRTASGQYEYVRQHGKLRRVGGLFGGIPDERWWAKRMKPGDLIFWEHTYKPQRKPPVTHVMVYLGRGSDGDLLMAGSQNSRGVDIYEFQPRVPYGGHGGFLGLFKKKGRVVGFGRLPEPRD